MILIREQVEELHRLIVGREKSSDDVDRLWELLPLVNITDAALRARVADLERELSEARQLATANNLANEALREGV